jgi:hypothetical protein
MTTEASLYDTDIVAWVDRQVEELRRLAATAPSNAVDWPHLIEEIESLGRSQVSGVERKLALILSHLIKSLSAPDSQAVKGWRSEVASHQRVVRKQFSNSMRQVIDWQEVWCDARDEARDGLLEWGDGLVRGLPDHNPFKVDELISRDFDVDRALSILADSICPSSGA